MRQIAIDTETTGLSTENNHRIIEIAGVELINRRVTGKTFHYYINPQREVDLAAQEVHGFSWDQLKDKPEFAKIVNEFLNLIKDSELIIHNAPFDDSFIEYELRLTGITNYKIQNYCSNIIDTLILARKKYAGKKNNLDALCKRLKVKNDHRVFHGALLDSDLLAQVYLLMTSEQSNLFSKNITQKQQSISINNKPNNTFLKVIRANNIELTLHKQWLNKHNKDDNN